MTKQSPEIIEVNSQQVDELLDRAATKLDHEDAELMRRIVESYSYIADLVGDKNTTIARLRKLMFGSQSEKSKDILDDEISGKAEIDLPGDDSSEGSTRIAESESEDQEDQEVTPPGHGRHSSADYRGAEQIEVKHPTLAAGDSCPECQGTLYEKPPGVLVRFVGQAPVGATVYQLQKLRCHTCGKTFTAPAPPDVGEEKYDHTAASMIGLLKYGSGLPFNRLQRLQGNCEIPLAASTQWSIVQAAAFLMEPAYQELIRQAAQGDVLYNDDTTVKILELMGANGKNTAPDDPHDPSRTGLFTSGVVATREGVRIALFFSGRQHAGENLSDVLKHRATELQVPIQMCDGLSRNLPRELETILTNCLAHGRRKFVELIDRFPQECEHVIKAFKIIYYNDKTAREQEMSAEQRLAHHQAHSKTTMDDLHTWLQKQLDDKRVEPNSALGEAINYLLKRWEPLTLFLRQPGAPLDNNICERALKKAILHRKNSYFYKTRKGALVGDMYMSLIYTCELNGVSAFGYLNELQLNAVDVGQNPDAWMPWNYQENLTALNAA